MDLSDQRPDLVARESPNSYGAGPTTNSRPSPRRSPVPGSCVPLRRRQRQLHAVRSSRAAQQNPYFNSQPQNPQYGIPDMRQMPLRICRARTSICPATICSSPIPGANFQLPNTANLGGPGMAS
ncbi:hypothetical protein BV898_03872 [Hypsibius exemplaris]|uniref:Uncharacterized protein n=1 Tax=Hypsibius exemplaris TaxID=2072580 RepID=A0A1W0X3D9_HYPEX|nr:hypothetical protein BV898_03872 [Hypsibius exemplaris]